MLDRQLDRQRDIVAIDGGLLGGLVTGDFLLLGVALDPALAGRRRLSSLSRSFSMPAMPWPVASSDEAEHVGGEAGVGIGALVVRLDESGS